MLRDEASGSVLSVAAIVVLQYCCHSLSWFWTLEHVMFYPVLYTTTRKRRLISRSLYLLFDVYWRSSEDVHFVFVGFFFFTFWLCVISSGPGKLLPWATRIVLSIGLIDNHRPCRLVMLKDFLEAWKRNSLAKSQTTFVQASSGKVKWECWMEWTKPLIVKLNEMAKAVWNGQSLQ